jgi:hypothetical protein
MLEVSTRSAPPICGIAAAIDTVDGHLTLTPICWRIPMGRERDEDELRHQNAVRVAEQTLAIASRHRDPRVKTIAVLNRPIAHIGVTISEDVADAVRRGETDATAIARRIFNNLFERARHAHATDVVEQLLAFAALHPHPGVQSIALLKRPTAHIIVHIGDEIDRHITAGIHETEKIAKSILNKLLGIRT